MELTRSDIKLVVVVALAVFFVAGFLLGMEYKASKEAKVTAVNNLLQSGVQDFVKKCSPSIPNKPKVMVGPIFLGNTWSLESENLSEYFEENLRTNYSCLFKVQRGLISGRDLAEVEMSLKSFSLEKLDQDLVLFGKMSEQKDVLSLWVASKEPESGKTVISPLSFFLKEMI